MGLFLAGDYIADEEMDKNTKEALFGVQGMTSLAPIASLQGFVTGTGFQPPVISPLVEGEKAAAREGTVKERLERGASALSGYQTFVVPSYGLIRGMTIDGPKLLGENVKNRRTKAVTDLIGITEPR